MRINTLALAAVAAPAAVMAWGDVGHRTVGYLAAKYLSPGAIELYGSLLANDQGFDISDAATWADTIKQKMPWSSPYHYINPVFDDPPNNCNVTWPSDCPEKKGCVVSAIVNYTSIVLDRSSSHIDRKNATMFLLHLIGDLHQPLHVTGYKTGGNDVEPICWNHEPPETGGSCGGRLNLHSVWDTRIPHKLRGLPTSLDNPAEKVAAATWAEDLFARQQRTTAISECDRIDAGAECILGWARESNALVCDAVLARGEDWILSNDLSDEYFEENKHVVDDQIGKAGVRLAAWLNAIAVVAPPDDSKEPEMVGGGGDL
ncbi:S1/P1 nuclease [Apodospora peruviana]|uniref:S1/P1 nuclease n=1 Tax=Apodospora peruviana TaxID=516989 RepID=A0AAE0HWR0_9PEZI|nr:S1/P1 nuclease [Apodospora peruviana]